MNEKVFRIISIDGGGIRGVFPAHIISCIEHKLNLTIKPNIDMITGTSTGAIIAAALAVGIDSNQIVSLYRDSGPSIFSPKRNKINKLIKSALSSLYNSELLKEELKKIFGEIKLGDINVPLLVPATDIGNGSVHVFKSGYSNDFTRDKDIMLANAVMASCSAPTYFDPVLLDKYLLADGGLWANNPSLAAVIDAKRRLNIDIKDVRVLSIGTGIAKKAYGTNVNRKWGYLRGWKGPEFISFMMTIQAQSIHNYLQLILKENQILRLNFETDLTLPMDDCDTISDLISRADRLFTYESMKIKNFFN